MVNPNPNRGEGFLFLNRDRRRGEPSPNGYRMKIEIPSFSRNLDIESFLDWAYELDKFFDMAYASQKTCQICGIQTQRRSSHMVGPTTDHTELPTQTTRDDMEAHETTSTR